jgi:SAM-dependent methyltransferase
VCGSTDPGPLFVDRRIDENAIDEMSFASRKAPEFFSWRLQECRTCMTVYAVQIPPSDALRSAYVHAGFDSGIEAEFAAATYAQALLPKLAEHEALSRDAALEVGAGTGAFLRHLTDMGFKKVTGVEPSREAVAAATDEIRGLIRPECFDADRFDAESFMLVCCFQTLEHLPNPSEVVTGAFRLLRPGGLLAIVTHDYRSTVNRLLGSRSPIIDIEHLQLFTGVSLRALLERHGFCDISFAPLRNRYPLRYWLRLLPLPSMLKRSLTKLVRGCGQEMRMIALNVGNIMTIAQKPIPD